MRGVGKSEVKSESPIVVLSPATRSPQYCYGHKMSTPGGAALHKDQLKAKYIGTGSADMSKYEWCTNMHRDTLASHVGHYDQMSYYAVAQNESMGRTKREFLEKILQPCGRPPVGDKEAMQEKLMNG